MNHPCAKSICALWLGLYLIVGCSPLQRPAELTPPAPQHYPLLAPETYGGTFAAQHLLEAEAGGQHVQLHTYIEIDSRQIRVVGFTPWQTRAFILRYDGNTLEFENFTNREMPFTPALILADIQQVLWLNLPSQGPWHVVDSAMRRERRVYFRGQLMTHIQYNGHLTSRGEIKLSNIPLDYQLRIYTARNP